MKALSCNLMRRNEARFMLPPKLPVVAWKARRRLGGLGRLAVAPTLVGAFAGVELSGQGIRIAAVTGYSVFVLTHVAVRVWGTWQVRRARLRLAAARTRMARAGRPGR